METIRRVDKFVFDVVYGLVLSILVMSLPLLIAALPVVVVVIMISEVSSGDYATALKYLGLGLVGVYFIRVLLKIIKSEPALGEGK